MAIPILNQRCALCKGDMTAGAVLFNVFVRQLPTDLQITFAMSRDSLPLATVVCGLACATAVLVDLVSKVKVVAMTAGNGAPS